MSQVDSCLTQSQYLSGNYFTDNDVYDRNHYSCYETPISKYFKIFSNPNEKHLDQKLFPNQPLLLVKNFAAYSTIELFIGFKNIDRVPRWVKVAMEDSSFFCLEALSANNKIGPGLSADFKITFTPDDCKDYDHRLQCNTDNEEFFIEIRCFGLRPVLDFKEVIDFCLCPVNYNSERSMTVRNIGNCTANFNLHATPPFSVTPASGCLEVNHNTSITIVFHPVQCDSYAGTLFITYSTGWVVMVELRGTAEDKPVMLASTQLHFFDTFLTNSSTKVVSLINKSTLTCNFKWTCHQSLQEEQLTAELRSSQTFTNSFNEDFSPCNTDVTTDSNDASVGVYFCGVISVDPAEGSICARTKLDVTFTFHPHTMGQFDKYLFCFVQGRESRLPLQIQGLCLGPQVHLSSANVNLGRVTINTTKQVEVQMENTGSIEGEYKLVESSDQDGLFVIAPSSGKVQAAQVNSLEVSFYATRVGRFAHKFVFNIVGSLHKMPLWIEGEVVPLSVSITPNNVIFGAVSYDFSTSSSIIIHNQSNLQLNFHLQLKPVQPDRLNPIIGPLSDLSLSTCKGVLEPLSEQNVAVNIRPKLLGAYNALLVFRLDDAYDFEKVLSVSATSSVATVVLLTNHFDFEPLLINLPVVEYIKMRTKDTLVARFNVEDVEEDYLQVKFQHHEGVVDKDSQVIVPFTLVTKRVQPFKHYITIGIAGKEDHPLVVELKGKGKSPVVILSHKELDWGLLPTLSSSSKSLFLENQSSVDVAFTAQIMTKGSPWSLSTTQGLIKSLGNFDLDILCYLRDSVSFEAKLRVQIEEVTDMMYCDLKAQGQGHTLALDSRFDTGFQLGPFVTMGTHSTNILVQNCGLRIQTVTLSVVAAGVEDKKISARKHEQDVEVRVEPSRSEIRPRQEGNFQVSFLAKTQCEMRRLIRCHTVVGRGGYREMVAEAWIVCSFVEPFLSYTPNFVEFILDKVQEGDFKAKTENFCATNQTDLVVQTSMHLKPPFSFVLDGKQVQHVKSLIAARQSLVFTLVFDPQKYKRPHTRVVEQYLTVTVNDHKTERLAVRACLNYPNLHFDLDLIDFGCILNHSTALRHLSMRNQGKLTVQYQWVVKAEEEGGEEERVLEEENKEEEGNVKKERRTIDEGEDEQCDSVKVNKAFEKILANFNGNNNKLDELLQIKPCFGFLETGQEQVCQFLYKGLGGLAKGTSVVCKVLHGPEYSLPLAASTALPQYHFDTHCINFGVVNYLESAPCILTFSNRSCYHMELEVVHMEGFNANQTLTICPNRSCVDSMSEGTLALSLHTTQPLPVRGSFKIKVSHFGVETFQVAAEPDYPRLLVQLPFYHLGWSFFQWLIFATERSEYDRKDKGFVCVDASQVDKRGPGALQDFNEAREEVQMEAEKMWLLDQINQGTSPKILQNYLIDFGPIVIGTEASKRVSISNSGHLPVTLCLSDDVRYKLHKEGFSVSLKKIQHLDPKECLTLEVVLFPQELNFKPGFLHSLIPLQMSRGPNVSIYLQCFLAIPELSLSTNYQSFGVVKRSQCVVAAVVLCNLQRVPCKWDLYEPAGVGGDKVFGMFPSEGVVMPQCRSIVHVVFTPTRERRYRSQFVLKFDRSTKRQILVCEGEGVEARLEVLNPRMDFCPLMPGEELKDEKLLVLRNPCTFPVEVYSVELDKELVKEEKVLRVMDGYDRCKELLLPARHPGQGLPQEVLTYYQELLERCLERRKQRRMVLHELLVARKKRKSASNGKTTEENGEKEDLDADSTFHFNYEDEAELVTEDELMTMKEPVARDKCNSSSSNNYYLPILHALASDRGFKLGVLQDNARFQRGLFLIIHGPPQSGKSTLSASLAEDYCIPVLTLDQILQEAIIAALDPCCPPPPPPPPPTPPDPCAQKPTISNFCLEPLANNNTPLCPSSPSATKPSKSATATPSGSTAVGATSQDCPSVAAQKARHMCIAKYKLRLRLEQEKEQQKRTTPEQEEEKGGKKRSRSNENKKKEQNKSKSKKGRSSKEKEAPREWKEEDEKSLGVVFCDGNVAMQTTLLPDDVVVHIVAERLLREDYYQGVIIDGLESFFTRDANTSASCLLRAANNRSFLYAINIRMTFESLMRKMVADMGGPGLDDPLTELRQQDEQEETKKKEKKEEEEKSDKKKGKKGSKDKKNKKSKKKEVEEEEDKKECTGLNALLCAYPLTKENVALKIKFEAYDDQLASLQALFGSWDRSAGVSAAVGIDLEEEKHVKNIKKGKSRNSKNERPTPSGESMNSKKSKDNKMNETKKKQNDDEANKGADIEKDKQKDLGIESLTVDYSYWDVKSLYLKVTELCFLPPPSQVVCCVNSSPLPPPTLYSKVKYPCKRSKVELQRVFKLENSDKGQYRWVIEGNCQVILKVSFMPKEAATYKETFNFELEGTKQQYQVHCTGYCGLPDVCREPSSIFCDVIKTRANCRVVMKKFVLDENLFDFGAFYAGLPISLDKSDSRDRDRHGTSMCICNESLFDVEASFSLLHPSNQHFLFEPPFIKLLPRESRELVVWAFPRTAGVVTETIVCCIKHNPEPLLLRVQCEGVTPELHLPKAFEFGKVLLHRVETRVVQLTNHQALPVFWKFSGVEELGDAFYLDFCEGVIPPNNFSLITMTFKSPTVLKVDKVIKIEVYDKCKQLGIFQCEDIAVKAEAFDVSVDLTFPKGACDDSVDFGVCKVASDQKLSFHLKNRGEFVMNYRLFQSKCSTQICNFPRLFCVSPTSGTLLPDKQVSPSISFTPCREICIRNEVLFKCFLYVSKELANSSDAVTEDTECPIDDSALAVIPIRLSAKAVYSKYIISPMGCLRMEATKTCAPRVAYFSIENVGEAFDFKFLITSKQDCAVLGRVEEEEKDKPKKEPKGKGKKNKNANAKGSKDSKSPKKTKSIKGQDSASLEIGVFRVTPTRGVVAVCGKVDVKVESLSMAEGNFMEEIHIQVENSVESHNNPPHRSPYSLLVSYVTPCFQLKDLFAIFEEHLISSDHGDEKAFSRQLHCYRGAGIFRMFRNSFVFKDTLLNRTTQARFNIVNTEKVSCDLSVKLFANDVTDDCNQGNQSNNAIKHKSSSKRGSSPSKGATNDQPISDFQVTPSSLSIPPFQHRYITVAYKPSALQASSSLLEVCMEKSCSEENTPPCRLTFKVEGEGVLPMVKVINPHSPPHCSTLLSFKSHTLNNQVCKIVSLCNQQSIPCGVNVELEDADNAFDVSVFQACEQIDGVITLQQGDSVSVCLKYLSTCQGTSKARVTFDVLDNSFESPFLHLQGHLSEEDVYVANISAPFVPFAANYNAHNSNEAQEIKDVSCDSLDLGEVAVKQRKTITFNLLNQSPTKTYKFQWPSQASPPSSQQAPPSQKPSSSPTPTTAPPSSTSSSTETQPQTSPMEISFFPSSGHLFAGSTKHISMTFQSNTPLDYNALFFPCKVVAVKYLRAATIVNWDNEMKEVKWHKANPSDAPFLEGSSLEGIKKRTFEMVPEPGHVEDSSVEAAEVALQVDVKCAYCEFEVSDTEFDFECVNVGSSKSYSLDLKNTSMISMCFSWTCPAPPCSSPADAIASDLLVPSPFSISPMSGCIKGGSSQNFLVTFTPSTDGAQEQRALCRVDNLSPETPPLLVSLKAQACMPPFVFEDFEGSSYLSRRDVRYLKPTVVPSPLSLQITSVLRDPSIRVVEFNALGLNRIVTKSFWICNKTCEDLVFEWQRMEVQHEDASAFRCNAWCGRVKIGKKFHMQIDYVSKSSYVVEALWRFNIACLNTSTPVLLVGRCREPVVFFDRSLHHFNSILACHEVGTEVCLMSHEEEEALSFELDQCTQFNTPTYSLSVCPACGVIEPNSCLKVVVKYMAKEEGEMNLNLVYRVEHKQLPLKLNLKATAYAICTHVSYEKGCDEVAYAQENLCQCVDMGEVSIGESVKKDFHIRNVSRLSIEFSWGFLLNCCPWQPTTSSLTITPSHGGVDAGETAQCVLRFSPNKVVSLRNLELVLKIKNGASYPFRLLGESVNVQSLDFSFVEYNFGAWFIYGYLDPLCVVLTITNRTKNTISLQTCSTTEKWLHFRLKALNIEPCECVEVQFKFQPPTLGTFCKDIEFVINGTETKIVRFCGTGVEIKLEITKPCSKQVTFGQSKVGECVRKSACLYNMTPLPVTLTLCHTTDNCDLKFPGTIDLEPKCPVTIPECSYITLCLLFQPKKRISSFIETLYATVNGLRMDLCKMSGSAVGQLLFLETEQVHFKDCYVNTSCHRSVVLANCGDYGSQFWWTSRKQQEVAVSPSRGFIHAGDRTLFTLTYTPKSPQCRLCDTLVCQLDCHPALMLAVSGNGMCLPEAKETVSLRAAVRGEARTTVPLINNTDHCMDLRPSVEGCYWSGSNRVQVPPHSTHPYELLYHPLATCREGQKHEGTMSAVLEEGQVVVYKLSGKTSPPEPSAKLDLQLDCRCLCVQHLEVKNWLSKSQRFRVKIQSTDPPRNKEGLDFPEGVEEPVRLNGVDKVEVAGSSCLQYKLSIFSHQQGSFHYNVTFTNSKTKEYMYFELSLHFKSPQAVEAAIQLHTIVRQPVQKTICISNPLNSTVQFLATSDLLEHIEFPALLQIHPFSEKRVIVSYLPLQAERLLGKLELESEKLGRVVYGVDLKADQALPETPLCFKTHLGDCQLLSAKFTNLRKEGTEYSCKVTESSFWCKGTHVAGSSGSEQVVPVTYEPCETGEKSAFLEVVDALGGCYSFPLQGNCLPPKPKGPLSVKAGSSISIRFKNVMSMAKTFAFKVDNECFQVDVDSLRLASKEEKELFVTFKGKKAMKSCLVVSFREECGQCGAGAGDIPCGRCNCAESALRWLYYLNGIPI